ncbi:MAG: YidC/Oxa1 family membrane protein insertase [Chloroflexota bacterium]
MSSIFGFIIHPMELGVIWLAVAVTSAGVGIILFTIAVRLVLAPLMIVQLRNAKNMQRLQPHLAELKKKHGKDREALSQATMGLYKEHGVNPAMGCLPLVLQFPILIGLFYGLRNLGSIPAATKHAGKYLCNGSAVNFHGWLAHCYAVSGATGNTSHVYDLFHATFLWLSNGLGRPDPLFILPVLAGVTQWIQSRMMLNKSTDPQQQMMNTMMNFMPLLIVFFATRYASGLSLYWVTSTTIGILIQYRITGLGLLPDTLGGIAARLGLRGTPSARTARLLVSQRKTPGSSNGSSNGKAKAALSNGSKSDETLNGSDGNESGDEKQIPATVVRPRKKPNRTRGGRGGGRRG